MIDAEVQGAIDGAIANLRRELAVRDEVLKRVRYGRGSPNSAAGRAGVKAPVGSIYLRLDGGAATSLYVKESGTGDTGWVAK